MQAQQPLYHRAGEDPRVGRRDPGRARPRRNCRIRQMMPSAALKLHRETHIGGALWLHRRRGHPLRRRVQGGEVARPALKLGFAGFGGTAAPSALLRDEVVTRRTWLTDTHFLDLLRATTHWSAARVVISLGTKTTDEIAARQSASSTPVRRRCAPHPVLVLVALVVLAPILGQLTAVKLYVTPARFEH